MRAIDLFAGAGGLSLGLTQAGVNVVAAIERDADACASYRANLGNHMIEASIEDVDAADLPDCDIVAGGPPCQSFSYAGKRDYNNPRNRLWYEFFRIVEAKQPAFVLLENVRGFLTVGEDKPLILAFRAIGYHVTPYLLNAADYGVPQRRLRVFFVGNRIGVANPCPPATHAQPPRHLMFGLLPWVTVRQALGIGGQMQTDPYHPHRRMNGDDVPSATINSGSRSDHRPAFILDEPSRTLRSGNHGQPGYSPRHVAGYVPTDRTDHGVLDLDAPSCAIKAGGNFEADGHMGGPCPPALPYVPLDEVSPTIMGGHCEQVHNGHRIATLRRLTVAECARLQDFPPSFVFHGSKTSQYRQVGNAVAVGMAKALGKALLITEKLRTW